MQNEEKNIEKKIYEWKVDDKEKEEEKKEKKKKKEREISTDEEGRARKACEG